MSTFTVAAQLLITLTGVTALAAAYSVARKIVVCGTIRVTFSLGSAAICFTWRRSTTKAREIRGPINRPPRRRETGVAKARPKCRAIEQGSYHR